MSSAVVVVVGGVGNGAGGCVRVCGGGGGGVLNPFFSVGKRLLLENEIHRPKKNLSKLTFLFTCICYLLYFLSIFFFFKRFFIGAILFAKNKNPVLGCSPGLKIRNSILYFCLCSVLPLPPPPPRTV